VASEPKQVQCLFDAQFLEQDDTKALWEKSSVVVALHPDEATSPVVMEAIEQGKPFAVVPCCVFRSLFPFRVTPEGRQVVSYEDYIAHLKALSPKIRVAELDIPGRATVLYTLPEDCEPHPFERRLFQPKKGSGQSAKTLLQNHQRKAGLSMPVYENITVLPPFRVHVSIQTPQGLLFFETSSPGKKRKKEAEEDAASFAVEALGVQEDEQEGGEDITSNGGMLHGNLMCRKT